MQISEKELEDYIFEDLTHNSGTGLRSRGLKTYHSALLYDDKVHRCKWLRQVELGPYGRADIVGFYRIKQTIFIEIFELKIVPIEVADLEQICRYQKAVEDYFGGRFDLEFRLYLVGTDFKSGHYIHNNIYSLTVVDFEYSLTGIYFNAHRGNWRRSDASSFNFLKSLHHAEEVHGYR